MSPGGYFVMPGGIIGRVGASGSPWVGARDAASRPATHVTVSTAAGGDLAPDSGDVEKA